FGMGANQAQQRYDMEIVFPAPGKPDPNYHYIQVTPKLAQDKGDFTVARLSLFRSNNLPAQIWYLQPNKNVIEWNFTEVQTNVQIPLKFFQPDEIPGWRTERVQPKAPPALAPVVR